MIVSTTHFRGGGFGDFGVGKALRKPTIPDAEFKRRWDTCPRDDKSWDAWCDCVFGTDDPEYRIRCKSKPWACCPIGLCPDWTRPWEEYGAGCRYLYMPTPGGIGYGIGLATEGVSLTALFTDPIQANETKTKEAKEAQARAIAAQQEADYQQQLAQKQAQAKSITSIAIGVGATGAALILLGLIAKRRKVRAA